MLLLNGPLSTPDCSLPGADRGAGKLYHTDNPPNHDVPLSWSPEDTADLQHLGPQTPGGTQSNTGHNQTSCDVGKVSRTIVAGDLGCILPRVPAMIVRTGRAAGVLLRAALAPLPAPRLDLLRE